MAHRDLPRPAQLETRAQLRLGQRCHVGDDAADVVGRAAVDGQRDEVAGGLLGVGDGEQDTGDGIGIRDLVQAVGAEQVAVARLGVTQLQVGLVAAVGVERLQQ